jgi:hypothetical protein
MGIKEHLKVFLGGAARQMLYQSLDLLMPESLIMTRFARSLQIDFP